MKWRGFLSFFFLLLLFSYLLFVKSRTCIRQLPHASSHAIVSIEPNSKNTSCGALVGIVVHKSYIISCIRYFARPHRMHLFRLDNRTSSLLVANSFNSRLVQNRRTSSKVISYRNFFFRKRLQTLTNASFSNWGYHLNRKKNSNFQTSSELPEGMKMFKFMNNVRSGEINYRYLEWINWFEQ